jgi:hypothetical protein
MSSLPYVTSPGNIGKAFEGIRKAATPAKVTGDFVKTVLKIPGGSGDQMTAFLKKIGFVGPDGTPTDLYVKFRNPTTSRQAVAKAISIAYAPLYKRNEYMHQLDDKDLVGLIMEETGAAHDSNAVGLIQSCIKHLKASATFDEALPDGNDSASSQADAVPALRAPQREAPTGAIGLNLGYTINLNLPATTDIAVFNAIFKSLKDNLLRDDDA